jgi:hypothetical protein
VFFVAKEEDQKRERSTESHAHVSKGCFLQLFARLINLPFLLNKTDERKAEINGFGGGTLQFTGWPIAVKKLKVFLKKLIFR